MPRLTSIRERRRLGLGRLSALVPRRRRIAFILSGGGSLGAVQVGMLRALFEAGIWPDLILGCSVGSINGAGFAADPTLRGVARLERIWRRLADGNPDLMPSNRFPVAVQLARKGMALHDPEPLENLLRDELPVGNFSQLQIRFQCVATDVETSSERWFATGPLVPALMASASLPAVYPAREVEGRAYIDGGVLNEVHGLRAVELGASELYVLHVGHLDEKLREVQRPFDGVVQAYWIHRRFRLEDNLARIPSHCVVHRLPAGPTPRLRFDDFSRGPELAQTAYERSARYLRRLAAGASDEAAFRAVGGDEITPHDADEGHLGQWPRSSRPPPGPTS